MASFGFCAGGGPLHCRAMNWRVFLVLFGLAGMAAGAGRSRESFNDGWRFARFGMMPDGSVKAEPGATWSPVTASSEEKDKGNVVGNAVDGKLETRWCAADGRKGEWLQMNFGRMVDVRRAMVAWEKDERYSFTIMGTQDGVVWKKLVEKKRVRGSKVVCALNSTVRAVRVIHDSGSMEQWASIREFAVYDASASKVAPVQPKGERVSPSAVRFDDSPWRRLDLPHDWGIEGPFRMELDGATGKLPWVGIGWYRKSFELPKDDEGKRIFLDLDGAMSDARVWLNGRLVGAHPYGYSSFRLELTKHCKFGAANVLAVRLDNKPQSSRWYPGAGLYRNTWLVKTPLVHVKHNGVFVRLLEEGESAVKMEVTAEVEGEVTPEEITHTVYLGGEAVIGVFAPAVEKQGEKWVQVKTIPKPKRWSPESPTVYQLVTRVRDDEVVTDFGIRTFEFDPEKGCLLNGKSLYLKGVCMHHDLGPLGAAFNTRAAERQIELLREMGCNSIRTAHNPPAPELVSLCDRMGIVLQVEAFDTWDQAKRAHDYARFFPEWHERDLRLMVRNFRNSPSVAMWSIGNEIPGGYQTKPDGWEMADELRQIVKSEDPTRPVTMGNNARGAAKHLWKGLDMIGFNYKPDLYELTREGASESMPYGSETASTVSSRGEYFFPVDWNKDKGRENFHMSSYDLYAPPWAMRPDIEFEAQDRTQPWNFAEYVWTGFDYLGEPTPYNKDLSSLLNIADPKRRAELQKELDRVGSVKPPSRSSYFGIIDLCGFKKDRFYLYQQRWRPDLRVAHLLPHWNWPGRVGKVTPVHLYTNGDEAELFLNGKSQGRIRKGDESQGQKSRHRIHWDAVVYEPGELKAVVYKDGKPFAEAVKKTTGPAAALTLEADRSAIGLDGDLSFLTATVVDAAGLPVPTADPELRFQVKGPGTVVATGNGDPTDHTVFASTTRRAFNSLCLAILEAQGPGKIVVEVSANGLKPAVVQIAAE